MSLVQQAIVARCLLVVALEGTGGVSRGGGGSQEDGEGEESDGAAAAASVNESLATRAQVCTDSSAVSLERRPERGLRGVWGWGVFGVVGAAFVVVGRLSVTG